MVEGSPVVCIQATLKIEKIVSKLNRTQRCFFSHTLSCERVTIFRQSIIVFMRFSADARLKNFETGSCVAKHKPRDVFTFQLLIEM